MFVVVAAVFNLTVYVPPVVWLSTTYNFSTLGITIVEFDPNVPSILNTALRDWSAAPLLAVNEVVAPVVLTTTTPPTASSTMSITCWLRRSPQVFAFSPSACFSNLSLVV